ncbi:MAG TPA: M20/M25/M40 family metallo-hydrolase [Gemmatimonadales bacterium]|nr:M20/M25/M40 family metallo-hydrolase [Gemmatimonadales bacterium]
MRILTTAALLLAFGASTPLVAQQGGEAQDLLNDVKFLASDALQGRKIGTPGADTAAAYLARRFQAAGLQPAPGGWMQRFTVDPTAPAAQHSGIGGAHGENVIGVLPGRDPVLEDQVIVVGAHYDHLGLGGFGSLAPDSTGKVHNGADDNASGSAALVAIARRLAAHRPARTVVFIAFSGEEEGLLGSEWYVKHPLYPLDHTVAMINLDMVGRLRDSKLIVYGSATAQEWPALLDSLNATAHFELKEHGDGYGPSDQSSFYAAHRPVLHLFTDLHGDYHRPTDDWQKINADGLARVADFAAAIATAVGDRRTGLTFVDVPQPAVAADSTPAVTPGYGAYLGTIPDMSEAPGGVALTGVRAGSPAEKAGIRAGDVIVRMDGKDVKDLMGMTEVLRAHKAGDTIEIVVRRNGVDVVTHATLGVRGD